MEMDDATIVSAVIQWQRIDCKAGNQNVVAGRGQALPHYRVYVLDDTASW
jgi:hypothetical protein